MRKKEIRMKVVCSWCRKEGKAEFIGEKAPFDDVRETHGICISHRHEVHDRWRAMRDSMVNHNGKSVSPALFRWADLLGLSRNPPRS
jgi:hypothetical protein